MDDGARKAAEATFHDRERQDYANKKYYSIAAPTKSYVRERLRPLIDGKRVLDFGCGNGEFAVWAALNGGHVVGIDISSGSIDRAKRRAAEQGARAAFAVVDGEALCFDSEAFDVIHVSGVLHHVDLHAAYRELARVLRTDGRVLAIEGLRHNPLIHLYRRRTPHLRTAWEVEHILGRREIKAATGYFASVQVLRCAHLLSILAVPLRNTRVFDPVLRTLDALDHAVLSVPGLRWMAWMAIFELSHPNRPVRD